MKRPAVIFDIDGTLADNSHRVHLVTRANGNKPDWKAYNAAMGDDVPRREVIRAAALIDFPNARLLVSGREEVYRAETQEWLASNGLPLYEALLMRPARDYRPDTEIKREIYERDIEPAYDVRLVVDDRPSVIRMWRELGLLVLDVGKGEEF